MEDTSECVNNALELLTLEEADLPLGVSMSISIFEMSRTVGLTIVSLDTEEFSVFTNSLMDTTIQDGGKRERSDVTSHPSPKSKIKKIKMKTKIKIKGKQKIKIKEKKNK